jgi:phage recombination protein Bet
VSTALVSLTTQLAKRLDIAAGGEELVNILKATAFKGPASDAQMTALMVVANQYGLNPWTKEIYAFPDKNNGIVPVVGVDGWSRIINTHEQFDGMEFEQDETSCTCKMYRKDRGHHIAITEYMSECKRDVGPWKSHPKRMLRHKAMIQCARIAFGYVGIYDADEAEHIVIEKDITAEGQTLPAENKAPEPWPQDAFDVAIKKHGALVSAGTKTSDDLIAWLRAKAPITAAQESAVRALTPKPVEGEVLAPEDRSEYEMTPTEIEAARKREMEEAQK